MQTHGAAIRRGHCRQHRGIDALVLAVLTDIAINRTKFGRGIRAVAQDPVTATLMGVSRERIIMMTFLIGGMLAATFLAIFFVPVFFKVIFDRHVIEKRDTREIFEEIDHFHKVAHHPAPATPSRWTSCWPAPRTILCGMP